MSLVHQAMARYAALDQNKSESTAYGPDTGKLGAQDESFAPAVAKESCSMNDLRSVARIEISAFLTDQLGRSHKEWLRMFSAVQEAATSLQRTCAAAIQNSQAPPLSAIPPVVERVVAAAAAEAEVAAQQAQAETQIRIAEAQSRVGGLEAELRKERVKLQTIIEKVDHEHAARTRAEAALEEAQRADARMASAYKSQLQVIQSELEIARAEFSVIAKQLEAQHSERAKLVAALKAVQRAVHFVDSDRAGATPTDSGTENTANAVVVPSNQVDVETTDTAGASVTSRTLKLISNAQRSTTDCNPEVVQYASELLDQTEAAYWADLQSAATPGTVVDHLTENLRNARDLFSHRSASVGVEPSSLFKQQIMVLINTKSESSFGRHLGMAAYQLYAAQNQAQACDAVRAS
jgi:hypothetical protein